MAKEGECQILNHFLPNIHIISQINRYISEIQGIEYTVEVEFFDHPEKHEEFMTIDFTIAGYEVNAVVN